MPGCATVCLAHPELRLGSGDDAAVLRLAADRDMVVTSDLLTDGVDFHLHACQPWQIGRKAVAVNLSDLAAMACRPVATGRVGRSAAVRGWRTGARPLSRHSRPGGRITTSRWPAATRTRGTADWSSASRRWDNSPPAGPCDAIEARPGDHILVTGRFGGSILGKHFSFEPRVHEALLLHEQLRTACGHRRQRRTVARPAPAGGSEWLWRGHRTRRGSDRPGRARAGGRSGATAARPLDTRLSDGEDFELILALPPAEADRLLQQQPLDVPVTRIGQHDRTGRAVADRRRWFTAPLAARGFEHRQ